MTAQALRSRNWFGRPDLDGFVHRSWLKAEGFSDLVLDGRPVVGIANSWSEFTTCNAHLRQVAEAVKRGVWSAGGFPMECPTISLGEVLMKPTTMLFRNLMAMDVEESIRAYPMDAAVLLSGCDKTTPAMLMGAASADVPAVMLTGGPMLRGRWRTEDLGSGTDVWRLWSERRADRLTDEELCEAESCMSRSAGHCMVMGTASTMASMAEALGMTLPGNAAIPAPDSRRLALAEMTGRRAVEMALAGGPRPSEVLTAKAFDNAIRALMAIGGSTNAIIHLVAIAGRAGVRLPLARFDELSRTTPFLLNVRPSGKYLMEDFFYAGGLPVTADARSARRSWAHGQRRRDSRSAAPRVPGSATRPPSASAAPPHPSRARVPAASRVAPGGCRDIRRPARTPSSTGVASTTPARLPARAARGR
jgi:dihydroxy-acid dehydratase